MINCCYFHNPLLNTKRLVLSSCVVIKFFLFSWDLFLVEGCLLRNGGWWSFHFCCSLVYIFGPSSYGGSYKTTFVCLSVCLSVGCSVSPSICLSVRLSVLEFFSEMGHYFFLIFCTMLDKILYPEKRGELIWFFACR